MEVAAVVALLPHHLVIALDHAARIVAGVGLNGTLLAAGADGRAGELDADGASAALLVVVLCSEPGDIRDL